MHRSAIESRAIDSTAEAVVTEVPAATATAAAAATAAEQLAMPRDNLELLRPRIASLYRCAVASRASVARQPRFIAPSPGRSPHVRRRQKGRLTKITCYRGEVGTFCFFCRSLQQTLHNSGFYLRRGNEAEEQSKMSRYRFVWQRIEILLR